MAAPFTDSRAAGMGGVSIAVLDNLAINAVNPAALIPVGLTRITGSFVYEGMNSKTSAGNAFSRYANANGFRILFPIGRNASFAAGLNPVSLADFTLSSKGTLAGVDYERTLEGKGGLNVASASLFYSFGWRIRAGLSANLHFGRIEETWKTSFSRAEYIDSDDRLTTDVRGVGATGGVIVSLTRQWMVGAVYTPGTKLTTEGQALYTFGKQTDPQTSKLKIPFAWGVGTTYTLWNKLLLGADIAGQRWSTFKVDGKIPPGYRDACRFGGGAQFTATREEFQNYFKRVTYRLGSYYGILPYRDSEGNGVTELFLTLGIGLPFHKNLGRVDVAYEIGRRGSSNNPVEENIQRLHISVTGGEKWFVRGQY